MSSVLDPIKHVSTPDEAVDQFVGEQFIEWFMDYIPHTMKAWPVMTFLANAKPTNDKLKKFMLQRFLAAEAFVGAREGDPGFLRFAIANLSESDDPAAESALEILEKKRHNEMDGHKMEHGIVRTAHGQLWLRLLHALGLANEEIDRAEPKEPTRNYIAELSEVYSNSDWQMAVGAFAAHERAIAVEYESFADLLRKSGSIAEKDLEALTLRIGQNAKPTRGSGHILEKIVFDLEGKRLVWEGVVKQLQVRQDFLNGLAKYLS